VRDLRRALSFGPSFFEQCYVFRIPTHGRYYTPTANDRLVASRIAMRHHSAGAPALLTPLQRADNLVVNTMNRRGQVLVNQVLVKEARSTVADDDVAIGEWARA
jgi:tRNA A37 methylthiotransferase MiaB